MRKFQVTVNGNTYEVDVEEVGVGAPAARPVAPAPRAPQAAPMAAPQAAPAPSAPAAPVSTGVGSTMLEAPMQGKIVAVKVEAGQSVQEGDVVAILEAMKMENEIVAPKSGTVASVDVATGQSVEAGDLIASLN